MTCGVSNINTQEKSHNCTLHEPLMANLGLCKGTDFSTKFVLDVKINTYTLTIHINLERVRWIRLAQRLVLCQTLDHVLVVRAGGFKVQRADRVEPSVGVLGQVHVGVLADVDVVVVPAQRRRRVAVVCYAHHLGGVVLRELRAGRDLRRVWWACWWRRKRRTEGEMVNSGIQILFAYFFLLKFLKF